MHEMPDLVVAGRPEAHHAACVSVRLPQGGVDPAIRIERYDEGVAIPGTAARVTLLAGKLQTDLPEG